MNKENKRLYITGEQIRVFIPKECKESLKEEAKQFNLTLEQYAGLKLRGIALSFEQKKEETQ
jgi:cell division protein ZapA (FtsZ GTPase activity inhibitor)